MQYGRNQCLIHARESEIEACNGHAFGTEQMIPESSISTYRVPTLVSIRLVGNQETAAGSPSNPKQIDICFLSDF